MALLAALLLAALTVPALLINLYFTTLSLERWPGLRHRLAALFQSCGAETSSCAVVFRTPYARVFAGMPNIYAGLAWCAALLGLAAWWAATGHIVVPWPYLAVAAATVLVGVYLVHALVVVLRQPCPL
jgi:uncharacterized membrane protein